MNDSIETLLSRRLGLLPRPSEKPVRIGASAMTAAMMDFGAGVDDVDEALGDVPPSLTPDDVGIVVDPASFALGVMAALATIVFFLAGVVSLQQSSFHVSTAGFHLFLQHLL